MAEPARARLVSTNVGLPRVVRWERGDVTTAIFKEPVDGPVAVLPTGLPGDGQADPAVHGGHDKAVYAYAAEDAAWWSEQLGRAVPAGMLGENLTTAGVDVTGAVIGERWRIGDVVLEVAQPRYPCFKLGIRFEDPSFPEVFEQAHRPGAYLRVVTPGTLRAGDPIEVEDRPGHGLTIGLVSQAEKDRRVDLLLRMLEVEDLPARRRAAAQTLLDRLDLRSPTPPST